MYRFVVWLIVAQVFSETTDSYYTAQGSIADGRLDDLGLAAAQGDQCVANSMKEIGEILEKVRTCMLQHTMTPGDENFVQSQTLRCEDFLASCR